MRDESWLSVCWEAEKLGVKAASAVEPSDVAGADFSPNADVATEKEQLLRRVSLGVWQRGMEAEGCKGWCCRC